jgi:hypothetical protein
VMASVTALQTWHLNNHFVIRTSPSRLSPGVTNSTRVGTPHLEHVGGYGVGPVWPGIESSFPVAECGKMQKLRQGHRRGFVAKGLPDRAVSQLAIAGSDPARKGTLSGDAHKASPAGGRAWLYQHPSAHAVSPGCPGSTAIGQRHTRGPVDQSLGQAHRERDRTATFRTDSTRLQYSPARP